MLYIVLFAVFTAIAILLKGIDAVKWRLGLLQSVRTNLALALINKMLFPLLFVSLLGSVQAGLAQTSLPHIPASAWVGMPLVVTTLLYIVLHDFIDYWHHRLLHLPGIWPIHAVHHSDTDMNWTTTYRIHLIEGLMMKLSYLLLAAFSGLPPVGVLLGYLVFTAYNAFVHLDCDIHFGPLTKVFSTPRFHRWHHADQPAAYNTNFGNVFSLWDVMFGTYHVPGACREKVGFEGTPQHHLPKLVVWPFLEWGRALKARLPGQHAPLAPAE